MHPTGFSVFAVLALPEFRPGDDVAAIIGDAVAGTLQDGDILAITSKIVSKAEGRIVAAADREDAITAEPVRVVATRTIAEVLRDRLGIRVGVILTDTFGRPWREGQTDAAIGAAGVTVLDDLKGTTDANGKQLE